MTKVLCGDTSIPPFSNGAELTSTPMDYMLSGALCQRFSPAGIRQNFVKRSPVACHLPKAAALGCLTASNGLTTRNSLALAACLALTLHSPALAQDRPLRLQGLFCNTEDQIDRALDLMSHGQTPRAAAALSNKSEIVCTYVDALRYVVEHPVEIWHNKSAVAAAKYKALLTGVVVGDRLRPIAPPVEIFFAVPERLADAAIERPV